MSRGAGLRPGRSVQQLFVSVRQLRTEFRLPEQRAHLRLQWELRSLSETQRGPLTLPSPLQGRGEDRDRTPTLPTSWGGEALPRLDLLSRLEPIQAGLELIELV